MKLHKECLILIVQSERLIICHLVVFRYCCLATSAEDCGLRELSVHNIWFIFKSLQFLIEFQKQQTCILKENATTYTCCVTQVSKLIPEHLPVFERTYIKSQYLPECCYQRAKHFTSYFKIHEFFRCQGQRDLSSDETKLKQVVGKDLSIVYVLIVIVLLCSRTNQSWKLFKIQKVSFSLSLIVFVQDIFPFQEGFQ